MIIHSLCNSCLQPFQIMVESGEIDLLKQISDEKGITCPCPRLCGGRINLVGEPTIEAMAKDPRLKQPMSLSGKELFQAVNGMGLRDEIPKSKEVVELVLTSKWLEGFEVVEIQGKIYITELKMTGGVTLHLTSGPHGAQVLKITKKQAEKTDGAGNHR